ncbi:hypothetical protein [Sporolactobacillus spathodeae]|uniref:HPr domain-containing protein n=1 Tax=Sporolactobacillus spathodeae TaxID=1465502 RepID=A0ABS2Q9M2_9BACL|nr:hypothetical protein [Sporolactobacillus spathodeae]MBM7658488.1 hypothetical protein [Sporolactobacillus spathodeae]
MKHIFSFKARPYAFRLKNMIHFYKACEKLGVTVYVSGKNYLEQIHKLPQLLSVLLLTFSQDKDCLIVIEGEHTKQLKHLAARLLPQALPNPAF